MSQRKKLFRYSDIYDLPGSDALFCSAMQEMVAWHTQRNADYAAILQQQGFAPNQLQTIQDIAHLPPIPTLFFKKHSLFSVPAKKCIVKATTSGTGGKKGMVGIDVSTGLDALWAVLKTFKKHKLFSPIPTNYIILAYQPSKHNQMGITRTATGFSLITPTLHREYALKNTGTSYETNFEGIERALYKYQKQGLPVRFMGLPAFLHYLLQQMKEQNIRLKLHPKSLVCTGGGWKQFYFQKADRRELYQLAQEYLGVPEQNCRDFYGTVEHPVLYCDCKNHHFHVPVYSRILVRDPATLQPLPYGQPGIINLISPLMKSMPLISLLPDDFAILHEGKECGCGNPAPYFEILGRAGLEDIKTCAAGAGEMLEEQQPLAQNSRKENLR
ncbi:MAG: acyl-protein synthetase [Oscillospiraceae bacterium]